MKNTRQGFTLIELLIAIAIIGILAAVLIPNLLGARKRAYDADAQGCAVSLAKAAALYKIDVPTATGYPAVAELTADTAKYGTNNCIDTRLTVTGDAVTTGSYSYTVKHSGGNKVFTIAEGGLTSTVH